MKELRLAVNLPAFLLFFIVSTSFSEAPYRVHPDYEDTVRIAIIWNDAQGNSNCDASTRPIGEKTLEFVKAALNPQRVPNIKEIKNTTSDHATWDDIRALWGGDTIPHVIVHVNAGWSSGWNGRELDTIFSRAVNLKIGIVSIGDDAASLATNTFGFSGVVNMPEPLGDATKIDSLWIGLLRANDDHLKTFENGVLAYPGVNGIISNAVDSILNDTLMNFLPLGAGRCQADADKYNILYPQWLTMLGYQQGHWDGETRPAANELNVLVAIQDTTAQDLIRRGVALSFQPSFLANSVASQQITYDAIMFASLTHTLSVANKIVLTVSSDSLRAGDTVTISAEIFDQYDSLLSDLLPNVQWRVLDMEPGDSLLNNTGGTSKFTATKAWREVTIEASVIDPKSGAQIVATTTIPIRPGDPHHMDILTSPNVSGSLLNEDSPQETIRLTSSDPTKTLYAVVRDKYNNYVRASDPAQTIWTSANTEIANASGQAGNSSTGIISLSGNGTTTVNVQEGNLIPDAAIVNAEAAAITDAITRDIDGDGLIDRIELHIDVPLSVDGQNSSISITYNGRNLQVNEIISKSGNARDSVFYLEINENDSWGLQTDWILTLNGTLPVFFSQEAGGIINLTNITARDGVGPVIEKAVLYPSTMRYADTLVITFSEPVNREKLLDILPESAFNYYFFTDLAEPTSQVLQNSRFYSSGSRVFIDNITIILADQSNAKFEITPYKDMMQYVSGGSDSAGNAPPNASISRKVLVEMAGNNAVIISVYPNPYRPGSINTLPAEVRMRYANVIGDKQEGMLVSVISKKPLVPFTDKPKDGKESYGKATIYDAVGNLMASGVDLLKASTSTNYGLFWEARNRNGRKVEGGIYLAVVKFRDIDNNSYIKNIKLGVQ
jgi:archaellum component FlaF (FlaF/FlaG flagellin family)